MLHYRRAFRNALTTADIGEMMSSVCALPCAQALQRKYLCARKKSCAVCAKGAVAAFSPRPRAPKHSLSRSCKVRSFRQRTTITRHKRKSAGDAPRHFSYLYLLRYTEAALKDRSRQLETPAESGCPRLTARFPLRQLCRRFLFTPRPRSGTAPY